ncbi:uncharacterized protein [Epargyreus clarus]|uniref:uncharacterized protein n=1 Tax=Epargyreus clarus TaxID=520877 RepID=UPI003C2D358A
MQTIIRSILFLIITTCAYADPIDRGVRTGAVMKMLREMVNQTKADTLNLPANATSIRENITDTFSCENRTYGYYADVDNDCQIFHVCLTSKGARGRNTTYKWSFICPKETVFNQEVLVCTRPRESIPCEDSSLYYDLNLEIGKIDEPDGEKAENTNQAPNRHVERFPVKNQRRPGNKKQNIIVEELMKEAMEQMEVINDEIVESQDVNFENTEEIDENNDVGVISWDKINLDDKTDVKPMPEREEVTPVVISASEMNIPVVLETDEAMLNTRIARERSMRTGRQYRGAIKFKSDSRL